MIPGLPHSGIRGVKGAVRWVYYTAAAIEGYTVRPLGRGEWSLSATVVQGRLSPRQHPLTFAALLEHGRIWLWPVLDFDLTAKTLTARLAGPWRRGDVRMSRFVKLEPVTLRLANGDTLTVKLLVNAGEQHDVFTRIYLADAGGRLRVNPLEIGSRESAPICSTCR